MLKLNVLVLLLAIIVSIYIFQSCNKPDQDKSKVPESQVKTENTHDSIIAEPYKDTISRLSEKPSPDSLKAIGKKKRIDSLKALKEKEVKLEAYYFHPTARCVTCRNIEAYSLEAVQLWEDKNKKKVTWNELNIEDSVNEHYADEYSLEFSSLVIVKYVGGKKEKWKNLEDTWKLVNDKSAFIKYVSSELSEFAKQK